MEYEYKIGDRVTIHCYDGVKRTFTITKIEPNVLVDEPEYMRSILTTQYTMWDGKTKAEWKSHEGRLKNLDMDYCHKLRKQKIKNFLSA